MEIIKFDEMKKTWNQISKNHTGNEPSSFELEVYKKLLNFFHVGHYYYYIFNVGSVSMEFVSESIVPILGCPTTVFDAEWIFDNIHPDDKPRFIAYEHTVTDFFSQLPPEKTLKYKVSYDYRLRCPDGSYKWFLQQTVTIQSSENGAVIRVLGVHTDITHLKTDDKGSGLSFLGLDGEPSFYNVSINNPVLLLRKELFSKREKEVLQLMLIGKSTYEIARLLFVSIHTVNSHRKNIFAKSKCSSLVELGSKSIKENWI